MTCERKLAARREYANTRRVPRTDRRQDEDGFREIELARDGLEGFSRGVLACWDED